MSGQLLDWEALKNFKKTGSDLAELLGLKDKGGVVTGVRVPPSIVKQIDKAAAQHGLSRSQTIRVALQRFLVAEATARRETLERYEDEGLSESMADQAIRIFKELPDGEIKDDERLAFKLDESSEVLTIRRERDGVQYQLYEYDSTDYAVRLEMIGGGKGKLSFYRGGEVIETRVENIT